MGLGLAVILSACGGDSKQAAVATPDPNAAPAPNGTSSGAAGTSSSPSPVNTRPGATTGTATTTQVVLSAEENNFFVLINQLRVQRGVKPLQLSAVLQQTAAEHSAYMDAADDLGHTEPAPNSSSGDRITNAGGDFDSTGENVACGNSTAQGTYTQWVNSSGHLANMIDGDYTSIGISRAGTTSSEANHDCPYYWTTDFGG